MRVNETKQAPEFREQSRKKALLELQSYKKELLQQFEQLEQLKPEENGSSEKGKTKKLGTHPGTGNFYTSESTEEPEFDDTWMNRGGFINQFLMVIIVFCFTFTIYMVSAMLLL